MIFYKPIIKKKGVNKMAKIHVMDEILANKIAAGEVVERCSSVVKELVENSIDAGATEIKIELQEAGTKEIKVTDNGSGMGEEDAVLAFSRHATSKLLDEDDLYRIDTLGFRGEALPSIASVSKVTLETSTGDVGTFLRMEGGHVVEKHSGNARKGTIMTISDLFYNTPARLKHMKSLYTELANITDYVDKIALSHSDIKFILVNNDHVLLNTDGSNNLLKTLKAIYGLEVAKRMVAVHQEDDDYVVEGFISLPEVHRSSRSHMITLVNGRVVRNMELNRIINESYHSFKPDNRYPIVVLNITVDPSLIDVNIHPTKMDIKFSKFEELKTLISTMIKDILHKKTLIPHVEVPVKETVSSSDDKTSSDNQTPSKPQYVEQQLFIERTVQEDENPYAKVETPLFINEELVPSTQEEVDYITPVVNEKKERLPEMYPVGVVHGTYIICQNDQGMYMIDQHAAKERVNYEYYMKKLGNPNQASISLLFPITMECSNSEFIILKEHFDVLRDLGFTIDEFGVNSIIIKAHPAWLPKDYEEQAIRKILDVIIHCDKNFSIEKFNERTATMLSCKMAIKANMKISMEEIEQLIDDLRNCDNPFNCPHGRPTVIYYSNYDLEKLFKRSGFENKV